MAKEILLLNENNFNDTTSAKEKIIVVDFFASWCGPCKMLAPVLEQLNDEMDEKFVFAKVDIDESLDVAKSFSVMSVPTLIVFKDGAEVRRLIGLRGKEDLKKSLLEI